MTFGKKHPWVLVYHKSTLGTQNLEIAVMQYSCIEKKKKTEGATQLPVFNA